MVDAVAFKTRARTIDHLGREQIADCPTAISELWKNAYDAYAREVALHIFDGKIPIAAILDDGHGMNRDEIIEKWLVIGTESKASSTDVQEDDRNGLPYRPRQGQKGIGRLSSGYLGSLLLLVSKRRSSPFVAALIDWRLFENPFLYLQDIEIPIVEFEDKEDLWLHLPTLFDKLMGNVWGDPKEQERTKRITMAWNEFDALEKQEGRNSTKKTIENTLIETTFTERHVNNWAVWSDISSHGTAMLMAGIAYDLEAQLESSYTGESATAKGAKEKLFQTLSNFTDPFFNSKKDESELAAGDFQYSVTAWEGELIHRIISNEREFDHNNLEDLEHLIEGEIDQNGIFRGNVKAFGKLLDGVITILPPYGVPARSDSRIGVFHIRLGSFEGQTGISTHPPEIQAILNEQVEKYGGLMIFRNGLRVMPYGREDNDYFEIEKRRGQNAGTWFWANRRLFGRVALSRGDNPNLRDKAGREGLIDNKAAKVFRDVVINILKESAKRFFGRESIIRKQTLPGLVENRDQVKAEEARKKVAARKKKEFRNRLASNLPEIKLLEHELNFLAEAATNEKLPDTETELLAIRVKLLVLKARRTELSLGTPPNNLGSKEADNYRSYRSCDSRASELIVRLENSISHSLETIKPKSSRDIAYAEINRNAAYLQHRLRKWAVEVKEILIAETSRTDELVSERNKSFHTETLPFLEDLEHGRTNLATVLNQLEFERDKQDRENSALFEPYISTLKNLQQSVDIESLVSFSMEG